MSFSQTVTPQQILEEFKDHFGRSAGDLQRQIKSMDHFSEAGNNSLVFVTQSKYLQDALDSNAGTVIAPEQSANWWEKSRSTQTILFSKNPELAACMVKRKYVSPTPYRANFQGVHPTAIVPSSVELGEGVTIAPFAILGENCKVGQGSFIGSHAVIEKDVQIGDHSTLHPHSYVGHSCIIGHQCEIMPQAVIGSEGFGYAHDHKGQHYRVPHTGVVVLEDDVHIGAGTAIDRGTMGESRIGKGTKIDNQCHLAHNTIVGQNGLITAQFVSAGSTTIGNHFITGGKTAVTGHIKICDGVQLAGLSGVSNNVDKPGQYGGYPLQPIKDFLRTKSSSVHIPEMRKQLKKVFKKVFPEESS